MQDYSNLTVDHFFNPSSKEFVENPNDTLAKLMEYPNVFLIEDSRQISTCGNLLHPRKLKRI
ncbi:MAG: hypothetical protein EBY41_02905 [Proteobacteria bacterium]|nr:hypothetical protein [Pseudomonadota bacterium]